MFGLFVQTHASHTRFVCALALIISIASLRGTAAAQQSAVHGTITDAQGTVVTGATITLTADRTPAQAPVQTARTGTNGTFIFDNVIPGAYMLQADAQGFSRSQEPVTVTAGMSPLSITLQVAGITEDISVTASLGTTLRQPTLTSSRLGLSPLETPASVQIINGDAVRALGDVTVSDAVSRAVGVTTNPSPANGLSSYVVRGFAGNTSVMQLYDGVQMYVGSGTVTTPAEPWMLERIEVINGPASVLYGTGAIGGLINIVPRRPSRTPSQAFSLGYGSQDTIRAAADVTGPIGKAFSYRVDASHNRSDGYVDRGDSDSTAVSGSLRWDLSPDLDVMVSNDFKRTNPSNYSGTPLINGRLDPAIRQENYQVADGIIRFNDNLTQLKARWKAAPNVEARMLVFGSVVRRHWRDQEGAVYQPATGLVLRNAYLEIRHEQDIIGAHGDVGHTSTIAGRRNRLVVGFDVDRTRFTNFRYSAPASAATLVPLSGFDPGLFIQTAPALPILSSNIRRLSPFVENELSLVHNLTLVAGLRQDFYDLSYTDRVVNQTSHKTFSSTGWRVGSVYNPAPSLALYTQYTVATDPVGPLSSLNGQQQQRDLSTGRQVEAGIKQQFLGGRSEWTFAAYRISKNNLLTADPLNPGLQQQVGEQSSRGIEVSTSFAVTPAVRVSANTAILKAQFDDFKDNVGGTAVSRQGNRPANVPNQSASVQANWSLLPQLDVYGALRYVGGRFTSNANTQEIPAFGVVDSGLRWTVNRQWGVDLRGYNIFDKLYANSANFSGALILARPRSVEISLVARY